MKTNRSTPLAILFLALFTASVLIDPSPALGQKAAPVTVTNTTANPVPVTGEVTVANPFDRPVPVHVSSNSIISAEQRGAWNVGITGTVRLHPDTATVQVARREVYSIGFRREWAQDPSTQYFRVDSPYYIKYRMCIINNAPQPIFVSVSGETLLGTSHTYGIEDFTMGGQSRVCNIYDLPGETFEVRVQNTGNNNSGDVRVNIVAH